MKVFSRCKSLPGALRKPAQQAAGKMQAIPASPNGLETSKLILYVSWAWFITVCVFSMVMIAMEKQSDTLEVLITASAAEVATATGFYFWKARTENKLKLRAIYGAEIYNDAGIGDE